ncbi:MAG TPA: DUF294 nucleotidyltransferase-like domain-containing protein [Burkholderiales bacterium]|nr:DUF294 nucleotidyltransferase-like domain-containing protein [Burkholderiales bacterium]
MRASPGEAGVDDARPLSAVMREPIHCPRSTPLRAALETMQARRIGSILVTEDDAKPVGILTLRDVVDRVVLREGALDRPVETAMSGPLHVLPPHATLYEAALLMLAKGIRHIPVVESGRLGGIVSEKDLFALQPPSMRRLAAAIRGATEVECLVELAGELRAHARELLVRGTAAEPLTSAIASLNDMLAQRVVELERSSLPPSSPAFCWLAFGSEGRREQTFATDQDNGIVFADGADAHGARAELLLYARRVNDTLARCGYALCKGLVMASNPEWCASLAEWQRRFAAWIDSGDPQALLKASIFFDMRPVHGARELADALRAFVFERVARSQRFLHQMAANAVRNRVPLGVLGNFRTSGSGREAHTLDLKLNGTAIFADAARVYGLAAAVPHTSTCDRLRGFGRHARLDPLEIEAWIEGFLFLQVLRLRTQNAQADANEPAGNRIQPERLNAIEKHILREALRQARSLQTRLRMDYRL